MTSWQPIETAPKNFRILTIGPAHPADVPVWGKWWQQTSWLSYNGWVGWHKDAQPTHWQHLPEPPA